MQPKIVCLVNFSPPFRNQTKYTQGKNSELRAALESARKRTEVRRAESREDIAEETSNV